MGLGLIVALVVLVVLALVAGMGYLMDASVPDDIDEGGRMPPAAARRART